MPISTPYIPETITVHLGAPSAAAQNVTVNFVDYIKNVASSEIYPTWEESAIRANILAQISYVLNRVYVEYYRSRNYDFDITNSTAVDQKFIYGRDIFDNIDRIVSDIFDNYIRREGFIEPLAAKYCNGTTSTCDGLSQWGSQELAQGGMNSVDILKYYYGEDIELVVDAPIRGIQESYPGTALRLGSTGSNVVFMQTLLNRISQNYPLIPKISEEIGTFTEITEEAVRQFQSIFNLTADGIIGRATWYKIVFLYVGVTKLSELNSEGRALFDLSLEYPDAISLGNTGEKVEILQFFIDTISDFYPNIPNVPITGVFGTATENAVIQFQLQVGLPQTGVVDQDTWNQMYGVFKGIIDTVFTQEEIFPATTLPYGGEPLRPGSSGAQVLALQEYLNAISLVYTSITPVELTGQFDGETEQAVLSYQRTFNRPETGIVNRNMWIDITNTYNDVVSANASRPMQFPGKTLKINDEDSATVNPRVTQERRTENDQSEQ